MERSVIKFQVSRLQEFQSFKVKNSAVDPSRCNPGRFTLKPCNLETLKPFFDFLRRFRFGKLQFVKPPVRTQFLHQFFMCANLADGSVFDHDDAVRSAHGREPVRNYKHSTPTH